MFKAKNKNDIQSEKQDQQHVAKVFHGLTLWPTHMCCGALL